MTREDYLFQALEESNSLLAAMLHEGRPHKKIMEQIADNRAAMEKPKREWVGMTDEEYEAMAEQHVTNCYFDTLKYAHAIEEKLKEKNT